MRISDWSSDVCSSDLPAGEVVPMSRIQHGLTWYLVKDARPMMGSTEELRAQMSGPLSLHGADSTDWLGVPLLRDGRTEERRVGQGCVSTGRSRWDPYTSQKHSIMQIMKNIATK